MLRCPTYFEFWAELQFFLHIISTELNLYVIQNDESILKIVVD